MKNLNELFFSFKLLVFHANKCRLLKNICIELVAVCIDVNSAHFSMRHKGVVNCKEMFEKCLKFLQTVKISFRLTSRNFTHMRIQMS